MATRQSLEQFINRCEDAISYAREQYTEGKRQEHHNDAEYTKAQQMLEEVYNELEHFALSCNAEQRERLHRMRLQIQQLQNDMILLDH